MLSGSAIGLFMRCAVYADSRDGNIGTRARYCPGNSPNEAEDSHQQEISLVQQDFTMRRLPCRVLKTCVYIGPLQVGEILEDLLGRHAASKHFQNLAHRNSHPANCRFPAADI